MHRMVVIGVGNELRSDDALGILVARELSRKHDGRLKIVEVEGDGTAILEAMEGVDCALLVDAMSAAGPSGSVIRIDATAAPVPVHCLNTSSHSFGVAEAIEMARELHQLPRTTLLYGIVGESFDFGSGLSDRVLKSLPDLLRVIEEDLLALGVA